MLTKIPKNSDLSFEIVSICFQIEFWFQDIHCIFILLHNLLRRCSLMENSENIKKCSAEITYIA